ncbi:hypothetical protein C8A01DRAFT_32112 [Parachaetomium inaequale]|uniref:Uncharacterized protein n=1 Tax=Parachaetomium inaequale TaxID=2588326 RepID=A0AAN6SV66_9PEZI|nr:hypothetical protein C8A01DRAFT_32112 [Parachaetomium inaequale]
MEPLARFRKTMRDLCGLLVTVVDSKVYLLHQTVREFLIDPSARAPLSGWKSCLGWGPSHGVLAAASMRLLLLDDFHTRPLDPFCKPEELETLFNELDGVDFLTYAATNWAEHLDTASRLPASDGEQKRQLLELGTRVCAMDLGGTPWPQVLHVLSQRDPATGRGDERASPTEYWDWWPTGAEDYYRGMPALHVASHLGLKSLVQHLLTVHGTDAKGPPDGDPLARTALHWACRSDNGACVSDLLQASDDSTHVNTMDLDECTPLHDACRGDLGHTTTFLLEQADADPETCGATHGVTALHVAAAAGSTNALGALLDAPNGLDVNPRDRHGRTPLMYAAAGWQLQAVDMLLRAGADVELQDEDGRTALLHVGGRRLRPPPRRKALAWSAAVPLARSVGELFAGIGRGLRATWKGAKEEANSDPRVLERVEQLKVAIKLQCMRTCSYEEVHSIVYGDNPTDIETFFDMTGPSSVVLDLRVFEDMFDFLQLCDVLHFVALPPVTLKRPTGEADDDENGKEDMVRLFSWLRGKGVTHILKVIVDDTAAPCHGDAAVTEALRQFHVESLDWRKPDLGPEAICSIGRELREVHLYWSGDGAVWEGWSSHEGLGRLECLDTIYLHLVQDEDINNYTGLYEDARTWENKLNAQRCSEHAMEKAVGKSTVRDSVGKVDRKPIIVQVVNRYGGPLARLE